MNIKESEIKNIIRDLIDFKKPLSKEVIFISNNILMINESFEYTNKGEIIIVAGYPRCLTDRAPLANKLIKKNIANHIILSGGVNIPNTGITESQAMFEYLVSNKVDQEKLIVENQSKTTIENAYFSLEIVNDNFMSNNMKLIALTSNFHIRRFLLALKLYFNNKSGINIMPMPSISPDCPPDSWHDIILGRAIVAREIQILEKHTASGRLPNFTI